MPIPLILWGVGAAVAATTAGMAIKGKMDSDEADNVACRSEKIICDANNLLEYKRDETRIAFEDFAKKKLKSQEERIGLFLVHFRKIRNVEFTRNTAFDSLQIGDYAPMGLDAIESSYSTAMTIAQGLGSGAAAGALLAYGAYSGVGMLATTAGGTAISSLSGAAAANATLAWLGGGAISAGGAGIAGGAMVLGGLVAGPALLIFSGIYAANASKKLAEANSGFIKAKEFKEEVHGYVVKMNQILEVVHLADDVLSDLNARLRRATKELENIIATEGADYEFYSDEDKDKVFKAFKIAQVLKAVIDNPILKEDGSLGDNAKQELLKLRQGLESID